MKSGQLIDVTDFNLFWTITNKLFGVKPGMGIRAARPGPMFFQPDRDEEVEPDPGPIGLRAEKIEPEPDSG